MNRDTVLVLVTVVALSVVAVGLGGFLLLSGTSEGGTGSVEVTGLTLSKDIDGFEPVDEATVFEVGDDVYLTGVVQDPEVGMEIYTNWYDEDGELFHTWKNDPIVLKEYNVSGDNTKIKFPVETQDVSWTPGEYSVELVIDEEVVETLEYEIVGGDGGTNSFEEFSDPEMIEDVALSKDEEDYEPVNVTRTFQTSDYVYTTGTVQNAEVGMEIYFKIYNDEGELLYTLPEEYRLVLEEYHINDGTTGVSLHIGPEAIDWKPGTYWKEILIDGETAATLRFEME